MERNEALELASRAWCKVKTMHIPMNSALAEAFADILLEVCHPKPKQTNILTEHLLDLLRPPKQTKRGEGMSKCVGAHLCGTCAKEFPTCDAEKIVWGIDRDPTACGAEADKVVECDAYEPKCFVNQGDET